MKDVLPIQFYTPKQAANLLHVNPSTLRKYCALVTKYHGKEYFKRDAANARIFTRYDVDMLKRIAELKKAPNVTLETAVMIALDQFTRPDTETPATPPVISDKAANTPDIATLQAVMLNKDRQIQQLIDLNTQLMQSNEQLSRDVQTLLARFDQPDTTPTTSAPAPADKLSLLKKLFSRT